MKKEIYIYIYINNTANFRVLRNFSRLLYKSSTTSMMPLSSISLILMKEMPYSMRRSVVVAYVIFDSSHGGCHQGFPKRTIPFRAPGQAQASRPRIWGTLPFWWQAASLFAGDCNKWFHYRHIKIAGYELTQRRYSCNQIPRELWPRI